MWMDAGNICILFSYVFLYGYSRPSWISIWLLFILKSVHEYAHTMRLITKVWYLLGRSEKRTFFKDWVTRLVMVGFFSLNSSFSICVRQFPSFKLIPAGW